MRIAYLAFLLLFISTRVSGQINNEIKIFIENDTTFFSQQDFQDYVDNLAMDEGFYIEDEIITPALLNTTQSLQDFFQLLVSTNYPEHKIREIHISEDKRKNIWFAYAFVNGKFYRQISLIVCKGTCKVLFFRYAK